MSGVLITALYLPDSCRLEKRVFKKLFLENAKLAPPDRRAFTNDVEEVVWEYTLKPSTIAIMPYADDEREYDEIVVLEATLKAPKNASRIAEVIHRAIPYPLVLVLRHEPRELLSLAPKRFSRSEKGATVAEELLATGWLDPNSLSPTEASFIGSIGLGDLPQANYYSLYSGLVGRVIALRSACRTGEYHVFNDLDRVAHQSRLLTESDELEGQINGCRVALRKESQFNRRVELNAEIKTLQQALDQIALQLAEIRTECGEVD